MGQGISSYPQNTQYAMNFGNASSGVYRGIQGAAVANSDRIDNLVRFTMGAPPKEGHEESLSSALFSPIGLGLMGVFGIVHALPWLKKDGSYGKNWKHLGQAMKAENAASTLNGREFRKNFTNVLKEEKNRMLKWKLSDAEKIALQKDRKFLGRMLDKIPGYSKLRLTGVGQTIGKSGAGGFIILDGVLGTFTEVIPTFKQLGSAAGTRQIGKTAARAVSTAAGWPVGSAIGSAAGATIGGAIGSVIPVLGTAVGAAVGKFVGGFLGGMTACHFANKAAVAVVGKSELELHQEKQVKEAKKNFYSSPEERMKISQQAIEQANGILAQDKENKEALEIKASAEAIINEGKEAQPEQTYQENLIAQDSSPYPLNFQGYPQMNNQGNSSFGALTGMNIPPVPGFNGMYVDMDTYNQYASNPFRA